MNAADRLLNLMLNMTRIAYADGFRDGAQWTHDSMNAVGQGEAFEWANRNRDSFQEMIERELKGEPEQ